LQPPSGNDAFLRARNGDNPRFFLEGGRVVLGRIVIVCIAVLGSIAAAIAASDETRPIKRGLEPADWAYTLPPGVTRREVTYYSDGVPCFALLFYPKGFSTKGKAPGIVLGQGWGGTHVSIAKYGARFAELGFVAMVIDYRSWGLSDGFVTLKELAADNDDNVRVTRKSADVIIKRTRLIPLKQVEDVRNAISYLQGESGVDRNRIGLWASSSAAGNAVVVAARDARVKAMVMQVPAISGRRSSWGPYELRGRMLEDAIVRARQGQGAEMEAGFTPRRTVDVETSQAAAEYRPFRYLKQVGPRPVLFIVAQKEQLFSNEDNAYAASQILEGPTQVIEIPDITHFDIFVGEPFEMSVKAAAEWFKKYL
jgi:dienelactone hydrolase